MASAAPTKPRARKSALAKAPDASPKVKPIRARTGSKEVSSSVLRQSINCRGNTVLTDFGRVLRDEPHKYIYPIKLYLVRDKVSAGPVMEWLRERYINAKGGRNHGARYEVRKYGVDKDPTTGKSAREYVDYILLEQMTDEERVLFSLEFGDVTDEKVVRDGKLRRPRLNKDQKKELDGLIDQYYLRIAAERRADLEKRGV